MARDLFEIRDEAVHFHVPRFRVGRPQDRRRMNCRSNQRSERRFQQFPALLRNQKFP